MVHYLHAFAANLNPTSNHGFEKLAYLSRLLRPTTHPTVRKTLVGIFKVHGRPKHKALALSLEHLSQLVTFMTTQNTLAMGRNNALIQVGFFGAFRRSELVNLKFEHLKFVKEGVDILIPRSKTDVTGKGQSCALPYGDDHLCPVTALKTWCEKTAIREGYIFRKIDRYGNLQNSPLDGKSVSTILKQVAEVAGFPNADQLSGHSLRRGFATTASRKGAPFTTIMRHGRWRHEGTVLGYIEEGQRFEENAAKIIFQKK